MKKALSTLFIIFSGISIAIAQCTVCHSFEEANKNPEQVTAIKINSWKNEVKLKAIPKDIGKFTNLRTLWLSQHDFYEIGDELCKLEKLSSLSLADDRLTTLPECIYGMKNLIEIILIDNEFSPDKKREIKDRFNKMNSQVDVVFELDKYSK